jgi:hypothetical protein
MYGTAFPPCTVHASLTAQHASARSSLDRHPSHTNYANTHLHTHTSRPPPQGSNQSIKFSNVSLARDAGLIGVGALEGFNVVWNNITLAPVDDAVDLTQSGQSRPNDAGGDDGPEDPCNWRAAARPAGAAGGGDGRGGGGGPANRALAVALPLALGPSLLAMGMAIALVRRRRRWRQEQQKQVDCTSSDASASSDKGPGGGGLPTADDGQTGLPQRGTPIDVKVQQAAALPPPAESPAAPPLMARRTYPIGLATTAAAGSAPAAADGSSGWRRLSTAIGALSLDLQQRRLAASLAPPPPRAASHGAAPSPQASLTPAGSRDLDGPSIGSDQTAGGGGGGRRSSRGSRASTSASPAAAPPPLALQLHEVIGRGAFGHVWRATWKGSVVAVKAISLPSGHCNGGGGAGGGGGSSSAGGAGGGALSTQCMAVREAAISTSVSHPNVIQVFTYTLRPVTVGDACQLGVRPGGGGDGGACEGGEGGGGPASCSEGAVLGWDLRLIMEFCELVSMAWGGVNQLGSAGPLGDRLTCPGCSWLQQLTSVAILDRASHHLAAGLPACGSGLWVADRRRHRRHPPGRGCAAGPPHRMRHAPPPL